jgi:hypothetical protein
MASSLFAAAIAFKIVDDRRVDASLELARHFAVLTLGESGNTRGRSVRPAYWET